MAKSHLKLWVILIFLMLIAVPALITPEFARGRLEAEYRSSVAIFGETRVRLIAERANGIYDTIVKGSGLEGLIKSSYTTNADMKNAIVAREANTSMAAGANRYLQSFVIQVYGVFFRGSLMLHWLIYVGLFLLAALVDGATQRKVKMETMRMAAPIKFAIATHVLISTIFIPVAYLLLPFAVTPWFMPVWTVFVALPLSNAIANAARTS